MPDATESGTPATIPACQDVDADGDGASACLDCDDNLATRSPGFLESCDGIDNDCDGELAADEDVDADSDGVSDCAACDAAGFWLTTRGLVGGELLAELTARTSAQHCEDYGVATEFMFLELDNVDGLVTCVYTGRTTEAVGEKPDAEDMNTEHTWPQSLGAEELPARCDLHHLFPTDSGANSTRSAYPFGTVTGAVDWEEGGSRLGAGAGGLVFEPREVHRGNVARAMWYFSMRYGFPIDDDQHAAFLTWHAADPVDATERARSKAIAVEQGVENPFVACDGVVNAAYGPL